MQLLRFDPVDRWSGWRRRRGSGVIARGFIFLSRWNRFGTVGRACGIDHFFAQKTQWVGPIQFLLGEIFDRLKKIEARRLRSGGMLCICIVRAGDWGSFDLGRSASVMESLDCRGVVDASEESIGESSRSRSSHTWIRWIELISSGVILAHYQRSRHRRRDSIRFPFGHLGWKSRLASIEKSQSNLLPTSRSPSDYLISAIEKEFIRSRISPTGTHTHKHQWARSFSSIDLFNYNPSDVSCFNNVCKLLSFCFRTFSAERTI